MKIVHVINSLATGGAERFVVNLVKCGRELGHDVSIILLQEIEGIPQDIAREEELPVRVLGKNLKDPRLLFRLRRECKDADIVHVHIFPAFYWAAAVAKPKVYTEHSSNNRRRNMRAFKFLERWAYGQYDRTITISDGVEEALRDHLNSIGALSSVTSVANGISDDFFKVDRSYTSNPVNIAIVGSLKPVKQHWLAIQAISRVENVTLAIAGDGPLRSELEDLSRKLNVEDRVHFHGNIRDIPGFLRTQDLLLTTSAWEGMSTVVLEAQATGIPVVGANVPGIREFVLDEVTGLLFAGTDPQNIADSIQRALSPELYARMCQETRGYASQFSIENSFKAQLEIYEEILSSYRS